MFSGDYTSENIINFVLTEQLPLVTKFSDQTAPKIFGGNVKTHLLAFFPGAEEESSAATLAELKEVAQEFKGKVSVYPGNVASRSVSKKRVVVQPWWWWPCFLCT